MDPWEARRRSGIICEKLQAIAEFARARVIHCYVSMSQEVGTQDLIRSLLADGRRVVVPVVDLQHRVLRHGEIRSFDELAPGSLGILEPKPEVFRPARIEEIDLVIVPGVAFDKHGERLGLGEGYYDRFLKEVRAPIVGLAFQFQIVEKIPATPMDVRVDILVTEEGVWRMKKV